MVTLLDSATRLVRSLQKCDGHGGGVIRTGANRAAPVFRKVTDGAHRAGYGRRRTELARRLTPVLLAVLMMVTYAAAIPMNLVNLLDD